MRGPARWGARLLLSVRQDRMVGVAVAVMGVAVAAALAAPLLSHQDPTAVEYRDELLAPSWSHLLGTDNFGRDVLTRLMYGGRASLSAATIVVVVVVAVGLTVGAVAGYIGGALDAVVSRVVDVLLAFPRLVLAIAVAAVAGAGLDGLVLAMSIVSWPSYARIVRGLVVSAREEGHVQAARAAGIGRLRILRTHIVGAVTGPVLALALVDFGEIVLGIAALSFLGLGLAPPTPEWGGMLNEARPYIEDAPWTFLAPGVAIFAVVLAANHIGDTIRDALDPRTPAAFPPPRLGELLQRAPRAEADRAGRAERMAAAHGPLVEVEDLVVDVGADGPVILDGLTLRVRPGECVGLVGESGSGKSTLAAGLLGLVRYPLRVRSGTVELMGERVDALSWSDWRPIRGRHIALVTQDPLNALNPVLRVLTQVRECGTSHGMTRAQATARAREVLTTVGLAADVGRRYPHELSGGMRQRVVIAMALVHRPRVLVADEPTTALDVTTQAGILAELARLRADLGIGLLFVSHDLRLVAALADQVAVLHDGRIVEFGTPAEILDRPQHPNTRRLVDAVPRLADEETGAP